MGPLKADVVVIGGGAAGSMCALTAAQRGLHVVLLEPNKMLGKKLRITGKGRCNVTNHCDVKTILANIPGDGRFLYSALNRLGPQDTMALFESLGVPLKTERGNRVFPVSDRSHDVANALERAYAHAGGKVVHAAATDILTQDGAVSARCDHGGARSTAMPPSSARAACPIRSPVRPATATGLRSGWAIRSRPRAPRSCRWNPMIPGAPRCRASPCAT